MKLQPLHHILKFFCLFILFTSQINAQETTTDPQWSYILPSVLSPNGKWLIVEQYNRVTGKNVTYFVNTKTLEKKTLPGLQEFHNSLLNNNLIVGKKDEKLVIIDLNDTTKKTSIDNVKTFKTINNKNILITHTLNNNLIINQLNTKKKNTELITQINNVSNYHINKAESYLIYQTNEESMPVKSINLKTFKVQEHNKLNQELTSSNLHWTINQEGFLYIKKDNNIVLVNLDTNQVKDIETPDKNIKLARLKVQFNSNNDFYLSYNIKTDKTYPETKYIDIWNANSHSISPSNFKTKHEIIHRGLYYNNTLDKLEDLGRARDREFHLLPNPNYLLEYNPLILEDFLNGVTFIEYKLISLKDKKEILSLNKASSLKIYSSLDNKHLLYPSNDKNQWKIYTFDTQEIKTIETDHRLNFEPTWTIDSKDIYYKRKNNIYIYNLKTNSEKKVTNLSNTNTINLINTNDYHLYKNNFINPENTLLFSVDDKNGKTIYEVQNGTVKEITFDNSNQLINYHDIKRVTTKDGKTMVYTEQNYNLPERIMVYTDNKLNVLFENNIPKELFNWRKQKTVTYTDKKNKTLKAIISYPKNFDKTKKYPMITFVYGNIAGNSNTNPRVFIIPTYINDAGFNPVLLNEHDYFVYYTDTYVYEDGPGVNALESIEQGLKEVLKLEPAIDPKKVGLFGHSFGGYKVSYIATQSNLFAAVVSGAGIHDVISGHTYNYSTYRKRPNYYMVEGAQFQLKKTFEQDPDKYLKQSPLLHAQTMNTPMLLWTGLKDDNVNWENTRRMFLALKRYKKPAIALFYNEVDHAMNDRNSIQAKDLTKRTMDWFDYFLKEKKDIKWIQEGIDYNSYSWSKLDDF